jgi:signal transduction histidine kinase
VGRKDEVTAVQEGSPSALELEKILNACCGVYHHAQLGSLIKGIVHNLNGALQILSLHLEMLERLAQEPKIDSAVHHKVGECQAQVDLFQAALQILLRRAADQDEEEPQKIHLNEILEEELEGARYNLFIKHRVQVKKAFSSLPAFMNGYRRDFSQAMGNLIRNAGEAMEQSSRKELFLSTAVSGDFIEVLIRDTGCGISKEIQSRLFQPFFTTKGDKHYGLGLYLSKRLLSPYGAAFRFASQEEGTAVQVLFPLVPSSMKS